MDWVQWMRCISRLPVRSTPSLFRRRSQLSLFILLTSKLLRFTELSFNSCLSPAMAMPLYLVATPIGNLEDITLRALRVLKEVSLIACEDTRHTRKLLDHFGINKPTISYHEHNEAGRTLDLAARLRAGAVIALVSDAGMPLVSDPGYRLVRAAIESGIPVEPVPGAS